MPNTTNPQQAAVNLAFGRKAAVYDAFGEGHEHLAWMRERVYTAVTRHVPVGSHLLEINAGTGLDAAALVQRGYRVHATDLAEGMVAAIEQKIETHALHGRLTAQRCSFTNLDAVPHGPFAGVYSNFGGLNCTADLTAVTRHLPHLLQPNGVVVWVIMPPVCPWELALLFKDAKVATRRLRRHCTPSHVEGVHFTTWYFTAPQVIRAFGPRFAVLGLEGLSVLTPTADNHTFAPRHPRLYHALRTLDERLNQWPVLRGWGDFFILTMRFLG